MRTFVVVLQMVIRILWVLNIVLGIIFFTGHLLGLVMLHETFGLIIALCLAILSILAITRARATGLGILGIVVAILLPIVGIGQLSVVLGSGHIVVELVHLLVGIAAIAVAEMLGARYRRATRVGRA